MAVWELLCPAPIKVLALLLLCFCLKKLMVQKNKKIVFCQLEELAPEEEGKEANEIKGGQPSQVQQPAKEELTSQLVMSQM